MTLSKKSKTKEKEKETNTERKKTAQFYYFVVGVELFSRYGFVSLVDRNELESEKPSPKEIDDMPKVDAEAVQEQVNLFNKAFRPKGSEVVDIYKKWFKKIADMGYILCNVVSDNGSEFFNKEVNPFLKNGAGGIFNANIEKFNTETKEDKDLQENYDSIDVSLPYSVNQIQTVPNDDVANPIAERFIQTFKRLWGQYTAQNPKTNYSQADVDDIVKFYNHRVHSSTGYSPYDILEGSKDLSKDEIQDTLFNLYFLQKTQMYLDPHFETSSSENPKIPIGGHVRIYTKWNLADKNYGEKKTNVNNWSYTIFVIKKFDTKEKAYELNMVGKDGNTIELKRFTDDRTGYKEYLKKLQENINKKDAKLVIPYALRSNFLKVIDYNAFKEYNIT
jgi:hypothetical protein